MRISVLFRDSKRLLYTIIIVTALFRLAFIGATWRLDFDDQEEGMIARSLLNGKGYSLYGQTTAHKPPAYTLLLAACYLPFQKEWAEINYIPSTPYKAHLMDQVLKVAAACLIVVLVYRLGQRLFNPVVAVLAALFCAANPILIIQLTFPGHMVYDMLIFTGLILLYLRLVEIPSVRRALILGLLIGLALLENPAIVIFVLLGQAWLFFFEQRSQSLALRLNLQFATLLVSGLIVAPWAVRNFQIFHQFVPFTDNFALELWYGNNPLASGGFYRGPQPNLQSVDLSELNEAQRNQVLGKVAVAYMFQHPRQAFELRLHSLYYFWFGTWQFSHLPTIVTKLWFWGNAGLILFSLAGLAVVLWKEWRNSVWLLFPVIGLALPYIFTHGGDDRYRAGLTPLLMVSLAYLAWWSSKAMRKDLRFS